MQVVLAGLQLDVQRLACQPRTEGWIRSPLASAVASRDPAPAIDLQVRMQLAQLARIAMSRRPCRPDRGGEIECSLGLPRRGVGAPCGAAMPSCGREIDDQALVFADATESMWPPPQWSPAQPGDSATAARAHSFGLIAVAMDHQHGAADLAIHRFADTKRGGIVRASTVFARDRWCARPVDAFLDLLVECGSEWMLRTKCSAKSDSFHPVLAVEFVPTLYCSSWFEMLIRQTGEIGGPMLATVPTRIAALTRSG